MKDKILGDIEYQNGAWIRKETIEVYGKSRDISIEIMSDSQDSSLEVQKQAYKSFLSQRGKYLKQMPQIFLNEYIYNYEDIQSRVEFSENSPLLKENINDEIIMKTIAPLVLLFDNEGNYGWICKCGWTKNNSIAILLSEKEPRIITVDQLRNLHKLTDDACGLLVHDGKNAWIGLEQNAFFGKDEDLRIEVEGSVEDGITPLQQQVYNQYSMKREDYFNELSRMMLGIYMGSDEKADDMLSTGQKIMVQSILPKTLFIDKEGNYGWICYSQWSKSCLGVLLSDDKLYFLKEEKLRNYRQEEKVKDDVMGLLFPCYSGFENVVVVRLMNDVRTMRMVIRTENEKELNEDIRKAYKTFLKMRPTFWNDMKKEMLSYYLSSYESFKDYLEIPESLNKDNVDENSVMTILTFTKMYLVYDGRIAWFCESPTDTETGLAFEFTKEKIELIGQDEII